MSERDLILVSVGICVDGSKSNQSFPHEVNNPMDKMCIRDRVSVDVSSTFTPEGLFIIIMLIQIGGLGVMTLTLSLIHI